MWCRRKLPQARVLTTSILPRSTFNPCISKTVWIVMLNCVDWHRILESGLSFWRSASETTEKSPPSDEWIVCQFSAAVTLSSIELRWQNDYVPEHFSISISRDGMAYEPVALVMERKPENRILIPKVCACKCCSLLLHKPVSGVQPFQLFCQMLTVKPMASGETFGLESIIFKEAVFSSVHTSAGVVLRNIQQWLFDAAVSSLSEVRDLALRALQKLLIASGSLCGFLQLATCLVLDARTPSMSAEIDEQSWNHLDELSKDGQASAQNFVKELATAIRRVVVGVDPQVDHSSSHDKIDVEKLLILREKVQDDSSHKVRADAS
ncbi:unnamed protein product [Phytophthora lilii]|uniref:Unnamed protein product n=1 Tax=Phytophthora lilii TaxID=2077276 RepID=A0A9W6TI69_9STRA|nr:unnamed protein product [Phytophthora lilii]